jgi:hypothetical protein
MFEKEIKEQPSRVIRERADGSHDGLVGAQEIGPSSGEQTSTDAEVSAELQGLVGNSLITSALQAGSEGGFDAVVAGQLGAVVAGIDTQSGLGSNQAMLRAMRRQKGPDAPAMPTLNLAGGKRFDADVQARFEAAMGHDFSGVRIHTDGMAHSKAREVNAHAFAVGRHIFFGPGEYQPGTPDGDRLIAHELTHVVQYNENRLGQLPGDRDVSLPTDRTEVEAYATERKIGTELNKVDAAIAGQEMTAPEATLPAQGIMDLVGQNTEGSVPDAVGTRMQDALGVGTIPAESSGVESSSVDASLQRSPDEGASTDASAPTDEQVHSLYLEAHELESLRTQFLSDALDTLNGLPSVSEEILAFLAEQMTIMVTDAVEAVVSTVEGNIEGNEDPGSTQEAVHIEYFDYVAPVVSTLPTLFWEEHDRAERLRDAMPDQEQVINDHIVQTAFDRYSTDVTRAYRAYQVLNSPDIELQASHTSGNVDNAHPAQEVQDTAQGMQAERSAYQTAPGGEVTLSNTLLSALIQLTQTPYNYTMRITELAGGAHSSSSRHYAGIAVDVDYINGTHVSATHPDLAAFMRDCRTLGATEVLGPGFIHHDHHVHAAWPKSESE